VKEYRAMPNYITQEFWNLMDNGLIVHIIECYYTHDRNYVLVLNINDCCMTRFNEQCYGVMGWKKVRPLYDMKAVTFIKVIQGRY
jgi:hypothetical protein